MLASTFIIPRCVIRPAKQQGVVMIIALIMLVAMTLAGIALVRSVDTTNVIAGNLSFEQAAVQAGDMGGESAIAWLQNQKITSPSNLNANIPTSGYAASRQDPASGTSWDALWTTLSATITPVTITASSLSGTGNTVSYIIQRLSVTAGDCLGSTSLSVGCAVPPPALNRVTGNGTAPDTPNMNKTNQQYYRITTRIDGPRNTLAYTQTIVAM